MNKTPDLRVDGAPDPADRLAFSNWGGVAERGSDPYVPRQRLPGEATSPGTDLRARPVYKPGDGDTTVTVRRPGSDHSHLKSYGNPT